jgi:hypothetical protein
VEGIMRPMSLRSLVVHYPVSEGSHARADYNHLPDGPQQRARD